MDTDNKKADDNQITGGEKDTLHNAGVDLSTSGETKEEFIDIDKAPSVETDPDLKKMGISFAENKEDLSLLKEQMDKKIQAQSAPAGPISAPESSPAKASVFKEQGAPKEKEIPIENPKPIAKEPKAETPKPESENSETNISDLEKEFNQTVGASGSTQSSNQSLGDKILSLQGMLEKIKEKLGFKKKEVKQELESLKKVKEDIAQDIENIKELEESEDKIEEELKKIEKIKEEVNSIEKEVKEELNS